MPLPPPGVCNIIQRSRWGLAVAVLSFPTRRIGLESGSECGGRVPWGLCIRFLLDALAGGMGSSGAAQSGMDERVFVVKAANVGRTTRRIPAALCCRTQCE